MRLTRIIFQTIFFLLFWYLLVMTAYPLTSKIPVELFLYLDPLAATAITLSIRVVTHYVIPSVGTLILTLIFGRWFCGWICPLGSHIDLVDWFKWRKNGIKIPVVGARHASSRFSGRLDESPLLGNLRKVKFYIFLIFIILAVLGVQMIWVLDPIVLITRSMSLAVYPYINLILRETFDTLYTIPAINKVSEPVYSLLKQGFLAFEQPAYLNHLTFALIILLVLGATILTPRFWCRYLCPLGAMLGWFGKWSPIKRRVNQEKCIECQKCVRQCRTDAIRDKGKSYLPLECVGCMDCVSVCPTKAVHFGLRPTGKGEVPSPESIGRGNPALTTGISRRGFIYAAAGSIIAVPALKLNAPNWNTIPAPIRPPGIKEEDIFLNKCIRCGECMKVCPTNGLQPTLLQSGWQGVWAPQLVPRIGYCEYGCNLCSQVCPADAIAKLTVEQKQKVVIGTAVIDKNKCIPYTQPKSCMVCEEMCPVPEKAIEFVEVTVQFKGYPPTKVLQPYVVKEKCIGCGICEKRCPIQSSPPAIYVVGTRIQTETA
ncbi:MAG: 4Fe-4S binding protein [bacterium]